MPAYVFTTLVSPFGADDVEANSINDSGQIVGSYFDPASSGNLSGFLYNDGIWTTLIDPLATGGQTIVTGINNAGDIVGYYYASIDGTNYPAQGFTYSNGIYTDFDSADFGTPVGINNLGEIATTKGLYSNGSFISVSVPGAVTMQVTGVNDAGDLVGGYNDGNNAYGFLDHNGSITKFSDPRAELGPTGAGSSLSGINNADELVGVYNYYAGSSSGSYYYPADGFLYQNGTYTTVDNGQIYDNGYVEWISDINNKGTLTGFIGESTGYKTFIAQLSMFTTGATVSISTR